MIATYILGFFAILLHLAAIVVVVQVAKKKGLLSACAVALVAWLLPTAQIHFGNILRLVGEGSLGLTVYVWGPPILYVAQLALGLLVVLRWMKKEPNQATQTTPGLRPSVSDL